MAASGIILEVVPAGLSETTENVTIHIAVKQYSPGGGFNSKEQTRIYDINGSMYVFYKTENMAPIQFYSTIKEGQEICVNLAEPNRILEQVCMCRCKEKGGK